MIYSFNKYTSLKKNINRRKWLWVYKGRCLSWQYFNKSKTVLNNSLFKSHSFFSNLLYHLCNISKVSYICVCASEIFMYLLQCQKHILLITTVLKDFILGKSNFLTLYLYKGICVSWALAYSYIFLRPFMPRPLKACFNFDLNFIGYIVQLAKNSRFQY